MKPTPEQWARLKPLFDEAKELSLLSRTALLMRVRADEGEAMAEQLEDLLKANDEKTTPADEPIVRPVDPPKPSAFKVGEVVLGRFQIVRLLGRGGMGEVYEANDKEMGRVALKTIRHDGIGDRSMLRRFKQEVQLSRIVTSPNVCRVHELFTFPPTKSQPVAAFLTMEFLEGGTLAERIDKGRIPWREAESIALQLCQGLEAIHKAGVIHRDLKCRNIMLTTRASTPCAVITDLGLALEVGETVAMDAGVEGTPGYMAPEQFENRPVSPATDIYALGVVLYEMVTGDHPFPAASPIGAAVRRAKRLPRASSIQPGLPKRWDKVIEKCLEYEPTSRLGSAGAVAHALRGREPIHRRFLLSVREPSTDEAGGSDARGGPSPSRRAFLYCGAGAVAGGAAATWLWPDLEMWRHPLPARRFVAAMMWPKPVDPQSVSLVSRLLATVSRELARAEAYDKQFLILDGGTPERDYVAGTPAEAAGVLGANLVLAASVLFASKGLKIALSVLDPAGPSPLRRDTVSGNASTLPQRATETAARLLGVRLTANSDEAVDEFSNVNAGAYQLFLSAQEQMRLPNNEGLNAAIEKYQAALREDSRFAAAYAGLAIAYGRRFAFYSDQSDLALAARNANLALEYGPSSSRAQLSQALIKLYSGDTEQAVRMFDQLLKSDPGNEEVLMYEARAYRETNRTELEERVYQSLLTRRPNFWPAYNDLGLIYRDKGAYQEAVKYFLQAAAIAPRAAIPWTNLAAAYFLLGKPEEARDACQRSIDNHPNDDALVLLGDIAFAARDYRKALDFYERARDINPNQHTTWRDIGDCYTMLRQPGQTRNSYRKAADILAADLQINPRSGQDWMTCAYYSAKLGDRSSAMRQLAEAEKRGAPALDSQLEKAQTLVLLGEKEKGIQLALELLRRGMSPVYIDLSVDLQGVIGDPRLRAALKRAQ